MKFLIRTEIIVKKEVNYIHDILLKIGMFLIKIQILNNIGKI